ncbi:retrotransposon protein, putative, unclassified [Senna tora]|uniref:Retrotransposon protein, putative, unclassified n=1 Tax=Senna tora TaxID=362788 RepID=A0A834XAT7_9FABA|nr:retrotransposon protein, putative, unclassified [Senna tora]
MYKLYLFSKTAEQIWIAVKLTYSRKGSDAQTFEIKNKIHNTKERELIVIDYYKSKGLWQVDYYQDLKIHCTKDSILFHKTFKQGGGLAMVDCVLACMYLDNNQDSGQAYFGDNKDDAKVKILHTNNGTEYMDKQLSAYLEANGIIHETSCSYTSAQNGVVERTNQHLLEVARSLMFTMNLPKPYWGGAVLVAAHLINRMPLRTLVFRGSLELLKGQSNYIIPPKGFRPSVTCATAEGQTPPEPVGLADGNVAVGYRRQHRLRRSLSLEFFLAISFAFSQVALCFLLCSNIDGASEYLDANEYLWLWWFTGNSRRILLSESFSLCGRCGSVVLFWLFSGGIGETVTTKVGESVPRGAPCKGKAKKEAHKNTNVTLRDPSSSGVIKGLEPETDSSSSEAEEGEFLDEASIISFFDNEEGLLIEQLEKEYEEQERDHKRRLDDGLEGVASLLEMGEGDIMASFFHMACNDGEVALCKDKGTEHVSVNLLSNEVQTIPLLDNAQKQFSSSDLAYTKTNDCDGSDHTKVFPSFGHFQGYAKHHEQLRPIRSQNQNLLRIPTSISFCFLHGERSVLHIRVGFLSSLPYFSCCSKEHEVLTNFKVHGINEPRHNHLIFSIPCLELGIIWLRLGRISQIVFFSFPCDEHNHGSRPMKIILPSKFVPCQKKDRVFSIAREFIGIIA